MHPTDGNAVLARLGRRQLGLFTRDQAMAAGFNAAGIKWRLERRIWREVRPGVYAAASTPPSWEQSALAVVLSVGATTVMSHRSAAYLLGLKGFGAPGQLEALTTLAQHVRLEGVVGRRSGSLFEEDIRSYAVYQPSPPRALWSTCPEHCRPRSWAPFSTTRSAGSSRHSRASADARSAFYPRRAVA